MKSKDVKMGQKCCPRQGGKTEGKGRGHREDTEVLKVLVPGLRPDQVEIRGAASRGSM